MRLSTGAEKRRVRAPSPYYETKTKALLEPGVAQIGRGGSEEHDEQKEYPECGEDDMPEPINTDEARDSMDRDSWMSSGQESVEFTGGICDGQISFVFDISIRSQESFPPPPSPPKKRKPGCRHEHSVTKRLHEIRLL